MTILEQVNASASPEVQVNENFEALEFGAVYAKRPPATSGLTWAYYGGRWGGFSVADGTLALTNAATNYVVAKRSDGVISVSTSITNWNDTANYARVYKITTAGSVVTAVEDHRAGRLGVHGSLASVAGPASSTDNAVARFDGTDGQLLQNSGVTIDDSNNIVTAGDLAVNGGDLTTTATTFNLLAGATTAINGGASSTFWNLNGTILNVGGSGISTEAVAIQIGANRTGNGVSHLDWQTQSGADFNYRELRNSGVDGTMDMVQAGTGRWRILTNGATEGLCQDSSGCVGVNNTVPANSGRLSVLESGARSCIFGQHSATGQPVAKFEASNNSYVESVARFNAAPAGGSGFYFWVCNSDFDGTPDTEAYMRGDGVSAQDGGTAWGTPADYAEFMENVEGNDLPVGATVVVVGYKKIRPSRPTDLPTDICGVVRPRSGVGSIVANAANFHWRHKYLKDADGNYLEEDYEVYEFDEVIPAVLKPIKVQAKEKQPVQEPYVEIIDGRAVAKVRIVERMVPQFTEHPLYNEAGDPLTRVTASYLAEFTGEKMPDGAIERDGKIFVPVIEREPVLHREPVMIDAELVIEQEKRIPRSWASYKLPDGISVAVQTLQEPDPEAPGKTIPREVGIVTRDGIQIGEATVKRAQKRKLNPLFDPTQEYVPPRDRPEHNLIGLTGWVEVLKGQVVNPRWKSGGEVAPDRDGYLLI